MSILKIKDQNGNFVDVPFASGKAATIKVGEVKLLEPTSEPTIENVGTQYDAVFNFGIPTGPQGKQGEKGETGEQGPSGADGKSATITIGNITTLEAGSNATVTNVGTETNAILNFGIPKGEKGESGTNTGGTGNVSSDIVNSIMVVDELPETEVEGVLYLVKESEIVVPDDGNLYNWGTAKVITASVSQSSNSIKNSSTGTSRTTYLKVEPNTTYKVEKVSDTVFTIGTTIEEPSAGVSLTGINKNETGATELTITTNDTDNYLAIWYHSTNCSLDEETIRKSIVVTKV